MMPPVTPAWDPLTGDPAEGTIRGMVAAIVREAQPLAVVLFGCNADVAHGRGCA